MSILLLDTNQTYLVFLDLDSATKRGLLARTDSGPRALPHIEDMTRRLSAVVQSGKPFATELAAADRAHDIGCAVLGLTCQIHSLLAALPQHAHLGEPAERVRATLNISPRLAQASYVDTAATAGRNRTRLPECVDALRSMPIARGLTGEDAAELFIGGGEQVRAWLTKRADAEALAATIRDEAQGRNLLHEARSLLVRLRATLEGEVSWRDDLPADLPRQIFSVLDARIAAAVSASRGGRDAGEGQDATTELTADAVEDEAADRAGDGLPQVQDEAGPDTDERPALRPLGLPGGDDA